jgi:hypothetical protein
LGLFAMSPIRLSDSELDAFLQEIAIMLHSCVEIGPGVLHRIVAEVQRRHFDPPDIDGRMPRVSKWE